METKHPIAQANENPVTLTWQDIYLRLQRLPIPANGRVFGVPRGGSIVAGLTGHAVDNPDEADLIVDDIVDSGQTRDAWGRIYPGKPFVALVDKTNGDKGLPWVIFPWEKDRESGAETNIRRLLQCLGEDPDREGLKDTPRRVVKAWFEMTAGYRQDPVKILTTSFAGEGYDQMILCRGIEFYSCCEHHMLPFTGTASVAYIPKPGGKVVGLSKMARVVDCFARRLQIQERLTKQIADAMQEALEPAGVGVIVQAKHLCMSCRGVGKHQSDMVTTALRGNFLEQSVRQEFLQSAARA